MNKYRLDSTALSVQAKNALLAYINSRDATSEKKLPREEELAPLIGVSRTTLRTALNDLAQEGIITRRQGRGTFINAASRQMKVPFNPVLEFADMIRRSGHQPSVDVIGTSPVAPDHAVAAALHLPENVQLLVSAKVFRADGAFCALCVDYFPATLIDSDAALDQLSQYDDSIFRFLAAVRDRRIVRDHVQITVVESAQVLRHLPVPAPELPNRPLLLLQGVNYDQDDHPVLLAREYIDTDVIQFSLIRQRSVNYSR